MGESVTFRAYYNYDINNSVRRSIFVLMKSTGNDRSADSVTNNIVNVDINIKYV